MASWIPQGLPTEITNRIMLDSDFTEEEHKLRFKACAGCDCGDFDKYHKCIHTAECTFEYLKERGDLLPIAEWEEINRGLYLLWKEPPVRIGRRQGS